MTPPKDEKELMEKLTKAQQKKVEDCGKEINEVLEKHGMTLDAQILVTQRGNIPQIGIVPKQ